MIETPAGHLMIQSLPGAPKIEKRLQKVYKYIIFCIQKWKYFLFDIQSQINKRAFLKYANIQRITGYFQCH